MAMQGLSGAHREDGDWSHDQHDAEYAAVLYADALLKELEK